MDRETMLLRFAEILGQRAGLSPDASIAALNLANQEAVTRVPHLGERSFPVTLSAGTVDIGAAWIAGNTAEARTRQQLRRITADLVGDDVVVRVFRDPDLFWRHYGRNETGKPQGLLIVGPDSGVGIVRPVPDASYTLTAYALVRPLPIDASGIDDDMHALLVVALAARARGLMLGRVEEVQRADALATLAIDSLLTEDRMADTAAIHTGLL